MIHITDTGQVAACVYRELSAILGAQAIRTAPDPDRGQPGDLFVGIADGPRLDPLAQWERRALDRRMRFVPIHVQGGEAIIGPEIRPDRPGCLACWTTRYFGARKNARRFAEQQDPAGLHPADDPWLTPLNTAVVGLLAARRIAAHAGELDRRDGSGDGDQRDWSAYYFNLHTMTGREWPVRPDSSCPVCGRLPDDSPEHARLDLEPGDKYAEDADRLRRLPELDCVADTFTGYRSNIVSSEYVNWNFNIGAVVSVTVTLSDTRRPEPCSGFCATYQDAHTVAILEGLERYAGVRPRGVRTSVRASIASLGERAIDPRRFGLHEPDEYTCFPGLLTPFRDDLEMDFVWAYSFGRQCSVLVPKQLAYYSLGTSEKSTFVIEGSIGCALGTSHGECVLHGIFEVVERDAFLMTWYARLAPAHLDVLDCADPEVRYRYRRLRDEGFDVFAFDITTDYGIPAVCVLARRRELAMPYAFCVGAAHLRPELAIKKALRELTAAYCRCRLELRDESIRRRAAASAEDPSKVQTMEDHTLFYSVPASGRHLEFLVNSPRRTSLRAMDECASVLRSRDLGDELKGCVTRILAAGSDVIAVKQTPPELGAKNLHTCKTLIPDAIPMTWGRNRRLVGLRRLDAALRNQTMPGVDPPGPNPMPHPYP
jgi:ribosomal protein S12 methylthiotransferase accessory factor